MLALLILLVTVLVPCLGLRDDQCMTLSTPSSSSAIPSCYTCIVRSSGLCEYCGEPGRGYCRGSQIDRAPCKGNVTAASTDSQSSQGNLEDEARASCKDCTLAPPKDGCDLRPGATYIPTSLQGQCALANLGDKEGLQPTTSDTDACVLNNLYLDGPRCYWAVRSLACSLSCRQCNPETLDTAVYETKLCASVCGFLEAECPTLWRRCNLQSRYSPRCQDSGDSTACASLITYTGTYMPAGAYNPLSSTFGPVTTSVTATTRSPGTTGAGGATNAPADPRPTADEVANGFSVTAADPFPFEIVGDYAPTDDAVWEVNVSAEDRATAPILVYGSVVMAGTLVAHLSEIPANGTCISIINSTEGGAYITGSWSKVTFTSPDKLLFVSPIKSRRTAGGLLCVLVDVVPAGFEYSDSDSSGSAASGVVSADSFVFTPVGSVRVVLQGGSSTMAVDGNLSLVNRTLIIDMSSIVSGRTRFTMNVTGSIDATNGTVLVVAPDEEPENDVVVTTLVASLGITTDESSAGIVEGYFGAVTQCDRITGQLVELDEKTVGVKVFHREARSADCFDDPALCECLLARGSDIPTVQRTLAGAQRGSLSTVIVATSVAALAAAAWS